MPDTYTDKTLLVLEWREIISALSAECATDTGKEFSRRISQLKAEDSRARLKKISALKDMMLLGKHPSFDGISDIRKIMDLSEKGSILTLEDIVKVKNFLRGSERIRMFLKEASATFPVLSGEYNSLDRLDSIRKRLDQALTESGELNENAYPALKSIRDGIFSLKKEIELKIGKILSSKFMDTVAQEKVFNIRSGRYVILIKSGMRQKLKGAVHDISSSGQTLYFEPDEISGMNSKLIDLDGDLRIETHRILTEISSAIGENRGGILGNLELLAFIDFIHGAARLSIKLKCSEPSIPDEPVLELIDAMHPLLYMIAGDSVVPNSLELGKKFNCLIISGANTGGKTVLLKTAGLCALMASHGLHIPASPDSSVGVFSMIFADIGDDQNLTQSLSTFSGQILNINEMIKRSDPNTLILIDEIITGTNPRQGAAMSQAILEHLIETGCRMIVTTHYSELKDLPARDARFQNGSVSFDVDNLKPTYRLSTGIPGVSYALEIGRTCGLDESVIQRASELLDSRELSVEALIEKMQKHEQELASEREGIAELKERTKKELAEAEERNIRLKRRMEEVKRGEGLTFLDKLSAYRESIAKRMSDLSSMTMQEASKISEEISRAQHETVDELDRSRDEIYRLDYIFADASALNEGDTVFIPQIERDGTVDSIDKDRETALIILGGSVRARFKIDNLYIPRYAAERNSHPGRPKSAKRQPEPEKIDMIPVTIQTSQNTIDLRGKRVEEGIYIMEQSFDKMLRGGINTVIVIHGHGTGAMKEAVRANLKNSFYSSRFRTGKPSEGGDGVTIVSLKE